MVPKAATPPPVSPSKHASTTAKHDLIIPRADYKKNYYYQQMLHRQLNDDQGSDNLVTRNSFSSAENRSMREDIRMGDQEVLRDIRELKSAGSARRPPNMNMNTAHTRAASDESGSSEYYHRVTGIYFFGTRH